MVAYAAKEWRAAGHRVEIYTFFYDKEECYPEILKDFKVIVADEPAVIRMRTYSGKGGFIGFFQNFITENQAARNLALKISPDTDILHPHDQLVYRTVRYFKKEVRKIPAVWMLDDMTTKKHSLLRNSQFDKTLKASPLKRVWYWFVDALDYYLFLRYIDSIAVVDTRDRVWAIEAYGKPTRIVRNGLDASEFPFRQRPGIRDKKINLLAVALLLPHRRFEDTILAVPYLERRGFSVSLTIIGAPMDAAYFERLQALVAEQHLEQAVRFLGKVSHEVLLESFRTADMFVFPAHLQSWGLAIFEAMSMGLPVIVSETTGASEVLENGVTAMLVPPFSPQKIAEAAERLADPSLYQKISTNGRAFVEKEISWDRYARELMEMFEEAKTTYGQ